MTGSPSTSNPYLNDHYYTYQHYVETSSNPLTSTTTGMCFFLFLTLLDWVITHDIDSFPIGTLFDYLFVLFFTNIFLTHIKEHLMITFITSEFTILFGFSSQRRVRSTQLLFIDRTTIRLICSSIAHDLLYIIPYLAICS